MFLLRMVLAKDLPLSIQVHACIKGGVVQAKIHSLCAFRSRHIPSTVSGIAVDPEPPVVDSQRR